MSTWQIILSIIIVGLSILMPVYYSYQRKKKRTAKTKQQQRERNAKAKKQQKQSNSKAEVTQDRAKEKQSGTI